MTLKFYISFGGGGREAGYGAGGTDASRGLIASHFVPVLAGVGEVVPLDTPAQGLAAAARCRTPAIHLCFALPHELPENAGRETMPVFGLGLAACPEHAFGGRASADWRTRLGQCGGAICFSTHATEAVRALMGQDFAVFTVPPALTVAIPPEPPKAATLSVSGSVLDTAGWAGTGPPDIAPDGEPDEDAPWPDPLAAPVAQHAWQKTTRYRLGVTRLHLAQAYREGVRDLLPPAVARAVSFTGRAGTHAARRVLALREGRPEPALSLPGKPAPGPPPAGAGADWRTGRIAVRLSGLVFAAVHGAWDRSWSDLLSAFVTTCRHDDAATLAIKTGGLDEGARGSLAGYLHRLGPFACRVVILDGAVDGGLDRLIQAASFYACASPGEAAPLPIMRFMAAGRPAIAPDHSALADFVEAGGVLTVTSGIEYEVWPGDIEERLSAIGWRLEWDSLCRGMEAARALAHDSEGYAGAGLAAARRIDAFCGRDAAARALAPLVRDAAAARGMSVPAVFAA